MNYNTSPTLWAGYAPGTLLRVIDGHVFEARTQTQGDVNPSQAVGRFTDDEHAARVLTEAGFHNTGKVWERRETVTDLLRNFIRNAELPPGTPRETLAQLKEKHTQLGRELAEAETAEKRSLKFAETAVELFCDPTIPPDAASLCGSTRSLNLWIVSQPDQQAALARLMASHAWPVSGLIPASQYSTRRIFVGV